ncbi:O-antigen polymerase [Bacillus sp. 1P10SD]|uniref:O-antigen polymerase n=1 Tax=Bacillus sp. 1P10SD TaxID=3132265 RepID=UPI0039A750F4
MYVLILLAIFLGFVTSYFLHGKLNTPLTIFTLSWNVTFLMSNLNLSKHVPITTEANFIIVGTYFLYLLGYLTSGLYFKKRNLHAFRRFNRTSSTSVNILNKGVKYSVYISLLGLLLYLVYAIRLVGISGIISGNSYINRELIANNIPTLFSYMIISFSIGGSIIICLLMATREKIKVYYYLVLFPPIGVGIITGQRILAVYCFVTIIVGIILFYEKLKNRKWMISSAIVSCFIFFIYAAKKRGNIENTLGGLQQFYSYTSDSYVAFSEALKTWDGSLQYGVNMFLPLAKLMDIFLPISVNSQLIENRIFVNIPYGFNVYTYLWDVVSDFGYLGLVIVPYILGGLSNYLLNINNIVPEKLITVKKVLLIGVSSFLFYTFISSLSTLSSIWYGYLYVILLIYLSKFKLKKTIKD